MREYISKLSLIQKIEEAFSLVIVLAGIATSVRMDLISHSLWWDEAALAYSFSQRSLGDLVAAPLEKIQSAPVGWLYFMKLATCILENKDYVLRIPAILFYIGIIALTFWILKEYAGVRYPMAGAAFVASMPLLVQYSDIFKPYISDGFVCLAALALYLHYRRSDGLRSVKKSLFMGLLFAVLIWFSNPACFVAAGLMLADGLIALGHEGFFRKLRSLVIVCIPLGISFVVYYLFWLKPVSDNPSMQAYWAGKNYPLLILSKADWNQFKYLTDLLFYQFYRLEWVMLILVVAFGIYAWMKKHELMLGLYGIFIMTYIASGLGMFPVNKRMWLFIYPLLIMAVACGLDTVCKDMAAHIGGSASKAQPAAGITAQTAMQKSLPAVLAMAVCFAALLNGGIRYYFNAEHVYWPGYEVKGEYECLLGCLEEDAASGNDDAAVYVCSSQTPIFDYYNDYAEGIVAGTDTPVYEGQVSYMSHKNYEGLYDDDIDYIVNAGKCYIISGDTLEDATFSGPLFNALNEAGYLELIYDEHDTEMFWFCADEADRKTGVEYIYADENK